LNLETYTVHEEISGQLCNSEFLQKPKEAQQIGNEVRSR